MRKLYRSGWGEAAVRSGVGGNTSKRKRDEQVGVLVQALVRRHPPQPETRRSHWLLVSRRRAPTSGRGVLCEHICTV